MCKEKMNVLFLPDKVCLIILVYIIMLNEISPKTGNILIAEPFMLDNQFKRSVILLVNNSEEGDLGYIINYTSDLLIKDVLEDCPNSCLPILYGGPAETDMFNFIHCCPDKIPGGVAIGNGLFWGGDFKIMISQINSLSVNGEEISFFMGYTGWGPQQLAAEVEANEWIVSDNFNPAIIFDDSGTDPWKECILNMGEKYAHIVNFPENPKLN
jgi:putative transcriptional regulator